MVARTVSAAPGVPINGGPPTSAVSLTGPVDFTYDPTTGDVTFQFLPSQFPGSNFAATLDVTSLSGMLQFDNASSALKSASGTNLRSTEITATLAGSPGFINGFDLGKILSANLSAGEVAVDLTLGYRLSGSSFYTTASLGYPGLTTLPTNAFNALGGTSGTWSDVTRWSLGRAPRTGDGAVLSTAGPGAMSVTFDPAASGIVLSGLSLLGSNGGSVQLSQADGTLQVNGTEYLAQGAVLQTGGTHTAAVLEVGGGGSYTLSGGSVSARSLTLGSSAAGTPSHFTMSGGELRVTNRDVTGPSILYTSTGYTYSEYVGNEGSAVFDQSGGANTTLNFYVSQPTGATGTYNLSGGSCSAQALQVYAGGTLNLSGSGMLVTNDAQSLHGGTVNQTGGVNTASFGLTIDPGSVYDLSSGTFSSGNQITNGGRFIFSGGTAQLIPNHSMAFFNQATGSLELSGSGTRVYPNLIDNAGSVTVTQTTAQYLGYFYNHGTYTSSGSDNYFSTLALESGSTIAASSGDHFFISGDVVSFRQGTSVATTAFQVNGAEFHLIGGGVHNYSGDFTSPIPVLNVDAGNTLNLAGGFAAAVVNLGHVTAAPYSNPGYGALAPDTVVSSLTGPGDLSVSSATATANISVTVGALSQSAATVNSRGTLALGQGSQATTSTLGSLTINGGTLDVNRSSLVLNYGAGSSPAGQVRAWLATGSGGPSHLWNGTGMTSTFAGQNQPHYGVGYTDGSEGFVAGLTGGQLVARPTLYGDLNFDGKVDASDVNQLTARAHFNDGSGDHAWTDGDMNYDGVVNTADVRIIALSGNYASTASPAAASASSAAVDYEYDPATGDVTLHAAGVDGIVDLHLFSAGGLFRPGTSTFGALSTKTAGELEGVLLGGTYGDGYDLGDVLPTGLTTQAVEADLTAFYGVSGSGAESAATVTPEPASLAALGAGATLLGRRRRRVR